MRAARSVAFDVALAAGVTAVGLAEIWVPFESRQSVGSAPASTAACLIAGIALTQRRTHPLPAGIVVLWTWAVFDALTPMYVLFFGTFVPMAIVVFSMARHPGRRVPWQGAAVAAAALLYFDLFVPYLQEPGEIVFHWGVLTTVWCFGFGLRSFERRALESTRRAVAAEVTAAERAMAAVVEERTRIARELHDVVAHAMSVMVVQAGAAEQVVGDDTDYVRRALRTIRSTGTDALAEMRRVVTMLRDVEEPGALAPQPGLGDVLTLVEDTRAAGLTAAMEVLGTVRPLPRGVDLAAYRIVQEALTNVRRHARATSVRVALTYGEDDLEIDVQDDGVGSADPTGGHGLVGMRERAALYRGTVEAGSTAHGFRVRAVLPVGVVV